MNTLAINTENYLEIIILPDSYQDNKKDVFMCLVMRVHSDKSDEGGYTYMEYRNLYRKTVKIIEERSDFSTLERAE